ncbi:hypothetical protein GCM10028772_02840 [Nocardioides ultimimeridianus]
MIQERLANPDGLGPLLVGTRPGHLDGYIAADELSRIVRILEMRPDPDGTITLRSTSFDMARVRRLSEASPMLAACDDVASMDQRRRADAECALGAALQVFLGDPFTGRRPALRRDRRDLPTPQAPETPMDRGLPWACSISSTSESATVEKLM